jgi:hypothetical protein
VKLGASSVGLVALGRLASQGGVVVHSRYGGALNLRTMEGLVSIVPQRVGRGPINIVLGDSDFPRLPLLDVGARLENHGGLVLGDTLLDYRESERYNPSRSFSLAPMAQEGISRNIEVARHRTIENGRFGGVGGLLFGLWGVAVPNHMDTVFCRKALTPARSFVDSLRGGESRDLLSSSSEIIGLGPGLTPSGDDFLSGLMVAFVRGSENGLWRSETSRLRKVAEAAKGRTTTLSAEYVVLASGGEANEKVTTLVEAICTGRPSVESSTLDVIRMGETSGTDLIAGALTGLRVLTGGFGAS